MKIFFISFGVVMCLVLILTCILLYAPLYKNNDVKEAVQQIQSVLCITLPLSIFSIVLAYFSINPLVCSLGWIVILLLYKHFDLSKMSVLVSTDMKVAMLFLSMILCAIYFVVGWIIDWVEGFKSYYFKMLCVILSVMLGFFVPINVLLVECSPADFFEQIIGETKMRTIKKSTWVVFGITAFGFVLYSVAYNICSFTGYEIWMEMGALSGIVVGVFILSTIMKGHSDSIKNCSDTRQFIFEEEGFIKYQDKVEKFMGYSHKERYDQVEALLFYKAYIESLPPNMKCEADSLRIICEHIKKVYKYYNKMNIEKRFSDNDKIYVLHKGKNRYCGDVMTSPWPLVKEYLRAYSGLVLENNDVPRNDRTRYKQAGFINNKEMWLLYFLEHYHSLSNHEKVKIIPTELKNYLCCAYKENAVWAIPVGCNARKMMHATGPSGREELYDFGDLILLAIYKWYSLKDDNMKRAREEFEKILGQQNDVIHIWEKWLVDFEDWNDFVVSNNLQKLVNIRRTINKIEYLEPIMFFENHSLEKILPQTKEEWLDMFKQMEEILSKRY